MPMEMRSVRLKEFGLADENRVDHIPSFWETLPRILPRKEVSADDVLIDLGSGMGRVVVLAARRYNFRRVIGVEISPQLHEIAKRNVERNRTRLRCTEIELVNADVLDYTIPEDVTVAYLYNPFTGPVFQHVVAELNRSVERNPRELRIVYLNPCEEERLLAFERISLVRTARAAPGRDDALWSSVRLYTLRPASQHDA
jgi:tRNA G37 N-methylase Trm5